MDKNQKSLVDTYFRKRNIAAQQNNSYYELSKVEVEYSLNNNINLNYDLLDGSRLADIVLNYPHLIPKINLSLINQDYVSEIVSEQPKQLNLFIDRAYDIDGDNITYIVEKQPQLLHRFKLSNLDSGNISKIITKHIDLIDFFDISNFESGDISRVVSTHPELINKFNMNVMTSTGIAIILSNQPQLIKYLYSVRFTKSNLVHVLKNQPTLISYFKNQLHKLDGDGIAKIIVDQPELIHHFKDYVGKLVNRDIVRINDKQPQLGMILGQYLKSSQT